MIEPKDGVVDPKQGASQVLGGEMDALSLRQALRDFEVANARAIDLTQRLIAANSQILDLQRELDVLRLEYSELDATHEAMRGSQAFRLADKIWTLRNLIGR